MPNYILKELNEEMTEGKKVVYPKMQTYTQHDFETVLKHMQTYAANFSEGSMRAVIDALVEAMKTWMPMGHSMKIDGLGTFSLSLGFKDQDAGEEPKTKYRHICIKGINFKPDPQLLADMNSQADFERTEVEVVVPRKCKYTANERMAKALAIIDSNGYMTLNDYALATGLCRSAASIDLKRLVAAADSPIKPRGSHSHKVWVRKS
ncbi:MAG: hypothetical protein IJ067_10960 [Prevotella sp.]|nr:hypothetical protein [Prevotella sp.]